MSHEQAGALDRRWRHMNKRDRRHDLKMMALAQRGMHGPFGPGPMHGPPFGRGRKRRGDVRAALLLALAEEPRNGYQLMQVIGERSGGQWRPSPGSVYPALAQLQDEGLIGSVERDGTKMFEITDLGREHLEQRPHASPPWEIEEEREAETELHSLVAQIHLAARQVLLAGDERQVARASETLAEARRTLYRILAEDEPTETDA